MQEVIPIGLCVAIQDMIDTKRFRQNFCDTLILRGRDKSLTEKLTPFKQELNSRMYQGKYLEGHKSAIISNIDKLIGIVASRYSQADPNTASSVVENGKIIIAKVLIAPTFESIAELEPTFKSKITLPIYDLFTRNLKRSNISMV